MASAKCPVCGTPITQTQYAEIQDRIRTEEQAKLAVQAEQLCARHEAELKKATAEAAAKARQEVEQKLAHAQLSQILDEYRDIELQKLRNEHARENEALQKKVQELNRKLEQKTANELGDGPEIDLYQALHDAFDRDGDNIYRVKKGEPGADIIHEVMHNGQHCQTIVYDSKNRRQHKPEFVEKLLVDKVNAKAEHAVLVTSVFPRGQRDLCIVDGVVLAKPSQAITIAAVLRDRIVNDYLRNLSFKSRTEKRERLHKLMTSEMFRQRMATVEHAIKQLQKIDEKEQNDHQKVWAARSAHYRTAHKSVTDLVIEVNVILQEDGPTDDEVPVAVSASATGTGDAIPFGDLEDDDIPF